MAQWSKVEGTTDQFTAHIASHRMTVSLNDLMEFDHVIEVHKDGTITEPDYRSNPAVNPELNDGVLDQMLGESWRLVGNSRQQGGGQIMHNSEFIGGRLADMILESPGLYVAIVCNWTCDCEVPDMPDAECNTPHDEGWGLAHLPTEE